MRIGKFEIDSYMLKDLEELCEVFYQLQIVPVRAEYMYAADYIEYTAESLNFDEVDQGMMAPYYYIVTHEHDDRSRTYEVVKV